jgi:hypothetical protein
MYVMVNFEGSFKENEDIIALILLYGALYLTQILKNAPTLEPIMHLVKATLNILHRRTVSAVPFSHERLVGWLESVMPITDNDVLRRQESKRK